MYRLRGCLVTAVAVVLSAGCGSVAVQSASSSARGIDIGETAALRIAEGLAVQDSKGDPVLSRPSDARSMTFVQAERALGPDEDFSLGDSAPVWLVHVYGDLNGKDEPPPRPPWAPTTPPTTASTSPPSYFVIVDAATGRVAIENY
jgi:hypothetical protein